MDEPPLAGSTARALQAKSLETVLSVAGHAHDGDAIGPLSRAMQSAAARLSKSLRSLRLG